MDRLPTASTAKHRKISKTDVVVVLVLTVLAIVVIVVLVTSRGGSNNSQAYIAGWNDMAPTGSTNFGAGMKNPALCDLDYSESGSNLNSQQWIEGCTAATRVLLAKQNDTSNFNDWKISLK